MKSDLVDVECTLEHETEKAFKVTSHNTGKTNWLPKSLSELAKNDPDEDPPCEATISLRQGLAAEKDLI